MVISDWLSLAALVLALGGALTGALWALLQGQINRINQSASGAHRRLDQIQVDHAAMKVELAGSYVKHDRLDDVLERTVGYRFTQIERRMDQQDRLLAAIASRLHVPHQNEQG
jgi:hypothetical protein